MNTLLHPGYFLNVAHFVAIVQAENVVWEVEDNYQKQTFRNRTFVCTDRGQHRLNIPIKHSKTEGKLAYKNVLIDNSYHWQRDHWRTLETAYRTSPFFEFYEDELKPLYHKEYTHLLDFNLETIKTISECLQLPFSEQRTASYELQPSSVIDRRILINGKTKIAFEFKPYTQVFGDRLPFLPNLSILDLLFNEGPNALTYLQQQQLPL